MEDLNVVIAGAAGEGVQTIGEVLADTIAVHGYAVFCWQEFESRIRGGQNSYAIRISDEIHNAPLLQADILLALNDGAYEKYRPLLKPDGILLAQKNIQEQMIAIPFLEIAQQELGHKVYANTIAIGALVAALGMQLEVLNDLLARRFAPKGDAVIAANRSAAARGFHIAQESCRDMCPWRLPGGDRHSYLLFGREVLGLAATRAGCRFAAAYPMSPATDIITFMAQHEKELGIFVEQAEDEIAAVNMAIGASFAGTRAMTATSGGGFALMTEALSLAGMIETPLVVILAQRPGPATGLPTRTAQADLLFAVHAGHGEFPKLVLAPSDAKDAFHLTVRAFNLADKYQLPVVLLVDQFLIDSRYSIEDLGLDRSAPTCFVADPASFEHYQRFQQTESGISPRLYPGQSAHLVTADSDEHNEEGHITEDLAETAPAMVRKRLAKHLGLQAEIHPPEEVDLADAEVVLVGWGSSRQALLDGIDLLHTDGVRAGMIHFTELWPLPAYAFPGGKRYWSVENNATSQLARLLKAEYGLAFDGAINRFDGLPLTGDFVKRSFNG